MTQSHAAKFVQDHGSRISDGYDEFISMLLATAPEGTKAHSVPGQDRTIYTFPDNSAAHVADFGGDGQLSAAECEEEAEELTAWLAALNGIDGGNKKDNGDDDESDDDSDSGDEDEDEDELEKA